MSKRWCGEEWPGPGRCHDGAKHTCRLVGNHKYHVCFCGAEPLNIKQVTESMLHYINEADALHISCGVAAAVFSEPNVVIGDAVQDAFDRQSDRLMMFVIAAFICWASGGAEALKATS